MIGYILIKDFTKEEAEEIEKEEEENKNNPWYYYHSYHILQKFSSLNGGRKYLKDNKLKINKEDEYHLYIDDNKSIINVVGDNVIIQL